VPPQPALKNNLAAALGGKGNHKNLFAKKTHHIIRELSYALNEYLHPYSHCFGVNCA
jgi:hypothetical protein